MNNNHKSCGRKSGFTLALALAASSSSIAQAQVQEAEGRQVPATDSDAQVTEIVVTAQRRSERLVDVPLSVNALSSRDLASAGVTNVLDLNVVTPGVTMQTQGPWLQPAIRGISSSSTTPGGEQNVAIYVDGVYQPAATGTSFDLPDISRVEVLKGPQGTLFGRNATGGAIQLFTLDPSFTTTGNLMASYGRFHDANLSAYVSTPLVTDKVAASLTLSHYSTKGWDTNLLTGGEYGKIDSDLIRGKVLANLSESTTVVLSGFYSHRLDYHSNSFTFVNGNSIGRPLGVTPIPDEPYEVAGNIPSAIKTKSAGATLRADMHLDVGSITSTSAYLYNKLNTYNDIDGTPAEILAVRFGQPEKTFSQELVFASRKFAGFSFVSGVFGYANSADYRDPILTIFVGGTPAVVEAVKTKQTSYAAFANGTYELSDRVSLSAGARYTYERRKINDNYTTVPDQRSASFNSVTPTASLIFKLDNESNLYFTFSRGFKSGQWDVSSGVPLLVQPEKLTAFEVGYKANARTFNLAAATFYYQYRDIQVQSLDPVTANAVLQNAAGARIYGAEISAGLRVTDGFRLTAQGAYTNAKYTSYSRASIEVPVVDATGNPVGGNVGATADLKGFPLARAPKLTANLTGSYRRDFANGTLELSGNLYHSSHYGIDAASRIQQPSYVQIEVSASWTVGKSGLTLGIYGKNLANEDIISQSSIANFGDAVSYAEPRSYGVRTTYSF
jgi:iron complex outermembrane receptor protein